MEEFHRSYSTRSVSKVVVVLMGIVFVLLGVVITITADDVAEGLFGVVFAAFSLAAIIGASISWWRAIVSELHIDGNAIEARHGDIRYTIARSDVEYFDCNQQPDVERVIVYMKTGDKISVPEPCFRRAGPVAKFVRDHWPEIRVMLDCNRL